MPKAYSEDLRLRAVWLHLFLGYDIEETAGLLAMSVRSIERYLRKYIRTGEVVAKKTGRPVDLVGMQPHEELAMIEAMLEHPEKTLSEIVRDMTAVLGRQFHISTICRYFQRNGVTRKTLRKVARQQSEIANVNFRADTCLLDAEMLVFLDESGFDRRLKRKFGYNFRGYRAEVRRLLTNWYPRITAIPIVCTEGLIELGVHRGTTNGNVFLRFVNEKLIPNLLPFNGVNPRSVVIMDNAAIHHSQRVVDAINATGALLIFLPPYSPHLMPCEGVIGQAKNWIRENELVWEQCDDLEAMVFEAFMNIAQDEIVNYIRHCHYL